MQAFADNIFAYTQYTGDTVKYYNFPLLGVSQLGDSKVVRLTYGCSSEFLNANFENCYVRFVFPSHDKPYVVRFRYNAL